MEQYKIDSRDMKTKLQAYEWDPKGEVKAILIFIHGMSEHMLRYTEMAEYLNTKGIVFAGIDLLGHGQSAANEDELGYFCENDPATVLVRDVHRLKKTVQDKFPGVPVFILGHSMGSFIARNYIERYGTGINGAILQAVGQYGAFMLTFGRAATSVVGKVKGDHYRSKMCTFFSIGPLVRSVKDAKSTSTWICKRESVVEEYDSDPLCGFIFTANGYHTLIELAARSKKKKLIESIPKNLPLYIVSGKEDALSKGGQDTQKISDSYRAAGIENVKTELIENARHEIHNEEMRYSVFDKYVEFITANL